MTNNDRYSTPCPPESLAERNWICNIHHTACPNCYPSSLANHKEMVKRRKGAKKAKTNLFPSFFPPSPMNMLKDMDLFVTSSIGFLCVHGPFYEWAELRHAPLTEESSRRGIRVKSGENPKTPTKGTVKILYYLITELGYCQITRDSTSRRCWPFDLILSTDSLGDASNKHFRPLDHQASTSTVSFCAS